MMLLLLLCAVFGLTTTVAPAVDAEKAPGPYEKDLSIYRCSAGVSLSASASNSCTNQPKEFHYLKRDGTKENPECTVPEDGYWPALPLRSYFWNMTKGYIYRHKRQNFGHLEFPRMRLDRESVQFNLRKKPDGERQISVNGVDRVDLLRARLQAPLWINSTDPRPRKSTFVKVHRGTIGAVEHAGASGLLMESGSAIYVNGAHSHGREVVAAVITNNTLRIGTGSNIIVYGEHEHSVLQFDEAPGTRLKPNVTICVGNPNVKSLITLKNATADMLSNYVYHFTDSVKAYGERDRHDGIHQILPYGAFSNPKVAYEKAANKASIKFGGYANPTDWKIGDSWSYGSMTAMYHYQEGVFKATAILDEQAKVLGYEYCLKYLEEINKSVKEYSCDTAPTPKPKTVSANAHPTTIGIGPETTTHPSSLNAGVLFGTVFGCLTVLGLSVSGLYYWRKKKSVDDPGSLPRKGALKGFPLRPVKARPAKSTTTKGQNRL